MTVTGYYFIDSNFSVYSVADNGAGAIGLLGNVPTNSSPTIFGDLALKGTTAYITYDDAFSIIDLLDPNNAFTFSPTDRFVGLGFSGSSLYGVTADAKLYQWNGAADATFGFFKVADITGVNQGTSLTDASRAVVPLPAAGWMLVAGIGGLVALRRRQKA